MRRLFACDNARFEYDEMLLQYNTNWQTKDMNSLKTIISNVNVHNAVKSPRSNIHQALKKALINIYSLFPLLQCRYSKFRLYFPFHLTRHQTMSHT